MVNFKIISKVDIVLLFTIREMCWFFKATYLP